jgi:hypothetical protein
MQRFEYKVVPAPARGEKVKGLKLSKDRFAHGLTALMNELAVEGWEYHCAETLPCEERKGFTGTVTNYYSMLIFRRTLPGAAAEAAPAGLIEDRRAAQPVAAPAVSAPSPADQPVATAPAATPQQAADATAAAPDAGPQAGETPPAGPDNGADATGSAAVLRAEKPASPASPARRLFLTPDSRSATPKLGGAESPRE